MYLKFRLLKVSFKTGKCLFVIPKWHFFHFFLGGGGNWKISEIFFLNKRCDWDFIRQHNFRNLILNIFMVVYYPLYESYIVIVRLLDFDNHTAYFITLTFSVTLECLTIDCYILWRITIEHVYVYIFYLDLIVNRYMYLYNYYLTICTD